MIDWLRREWRNSYLGVGLCAGVTVGVVVFVLLWEGP